MNQDNDLLSLLPKNTEQDGLGKISRAVDQVIPKTAVEYGKKLGSTIWENDEPPVRFEEFIESDQYLCSTPLSEGQYEICNYLFHWVNSAEEIFSPNKQYKELYMEITKGGGKTEIGVDGMLYIIYVLLKLRNPRAFLSNKSVQEQIVSKEYGNAYIMLLGASFKQDQAIDVLFTRLTNKIKKSPWFNRNFRLFEGKNNQEYFDKTDDADIRKKMAEEKEFNKLSSISFHKEYILFPKMIKSMVITGNPESGEGGDLIFFYVDEASGFQTLGGANAAAKAHEKLQSSANTRFPGKYIGIVSSYRRFAAGDYIHDLVTEAQEGKLPGMVGVFRRAWDLLPASTFEVDHKPCVWIPYTCKNDPSITLDIPETWLYLFNGSKTVKNEMQYLGVPPMASLEGSPFVEDLSLLDNMFDLSVIKRVDYSVSIEKLVVGSDVEVEKKYLILQPHSIIPPPYGDDKKYILVFDTSKWHNRTVLMLMHKEMVTRNRFMPEYHRYIQTTSPQIVVDAVLAWHPDSNAGIEVSLDNLYDVIVGLSTHFNIAAAASDGWDPSLPERLNRASITHIPVTSSSKSWHAVKELMANGLLKLPGELFRTPIGMEITNDFKRLEINHRTGKIEQSKQYTKMSPDFADCIKVGVSLLTTEEELLLTVRNNTERRPGISMVSTENGFGDPRIPRSMGKAFPFSYGEGSDWISKGRFSTGKSMREQVQERAAAKYGKNRGKMRPKVG